MIINEMFKDEIREIRKAIETLPLTGCIHNYSEYLEKGCNTMGIELDYIKKLNAHKEEFYKRVIVKDYAKLSKEELLTKLEETLDENAYCISDSFDNDSVEEVIGWRYKDADIYANIRGEMMSVLDKLEVELNLTKLERERKELEERIENLARNMEYSLRKSTEEQEEMNKVKEKLAKLNKTQE